MELFSHAATILPVRKMDKALAFYQQQLGFHLTFSWDTPITYAVLKRGTVSVHLTARRDNHIPSAEHTALYIFVNDVQAVYDEFKANGVDIPKAPEKQPYDMEEFDLYDPEGHRLTFGKGG